MLRKRRFDLAQPSIVAHPNDSTTICALHAQRAVAEHCPYLSILRIELLSSEFSDFSLSMRPLLLHRITFVRLVFATLLSIILAGSAFAEGKLKVAAVYTVPVEQQWVGQE